MGKRKLKSVDELELRLWKCKSCKEMECEIVSYTRPTDCNVPEEKEPKAKPEWTQEEIIAR